MAISSLMVEWLSRLVSKGILRPGMSIIDLGPQDVATPRHVIENIAARHVSNPAEATARIFAHQQVMHPMGGTWVRGGQHQLYAIFGLAPYVSVDAFDPTATFRADLNLPIQVQQPYSVVANFGTSEHLFHAGQSFVTVHNLLEDNGVALCVLPAFGHINHGFYNVHPTLYVDVAMANGYVLEDFLYIDAVDVRTRAYEDARATSFDFDALPIRLDKVRQKSAYSEECELARQVAINFANNMADPLTRQYAPQIPPLVCDYVYVAMRRLPRSPRQGFVVPPQGTFAPPPPPNA